MKIKITKEYEYYTGFGYFSLKEGEVYNVRSGSPNDDVILVDLGWCLCLYWKRVLYPSERNHLTARDRRVTLRE